MEPRTLVGSTQRTIVMVRLAAKPGRRAKMCFIIAYVHLAYVELQRWQTKANAGKRHNGNVVRGGRYQRVPRLAWLARTKCARQRVGGPSRAALRRPIHPPSPYLPMAHRPILMLFIPRTDTEEQQHHQCRRPTLVVVLFRQ